MTHTHTYTLALSERFFCLTQRRAIRLAAALKIMSSESRKTKVTYRRAKLIWAVEVHIGGDR
jgi:hypothetical protein